MNKYDVEEFIDNIEDNSNVDKLKQIKVGINFLEFNDERYYFKYNGKKYSFKSFSRIHKLQECDKKILKDIKLSIKEALIRSLKLACSMDLVNPKVILANSLNYKLGVFITYQENGIEMLIDYAGNLVMNKDDFYELFEVKEINVLDKVDLYKIDYLLEKYDDHQNLLEYLLFIKEKFEDLSYQNPILKDKYDEDGMHYGNYTLIGNDHDILFVQKGDCEGKKYKKIIEKLYNFTVVPSKNNKYFKYLENKEEFKYRDFKINFNFRLLSDYIMNDEEKRRLLSFKRYGHCYYDSNRTANELMHSEYDNIYIVAGKIKFNDVDYHHHCWVEYEKENETLVIDYTNNLVMEKRKYYKLYEAVMINKTKAQDMENIKNLIEPVFDFKFSPILYSFFAEEIMADFKKNEKVLLKK